jgi:hypothetical protein
MKGIMYTKNSAFAFTVCLIFCFLGIGNAETQRGSVIYDSQVQMKLLPEKMERELIQAVTTLLDCFTNKNEKCVLNMLVTKFEIMMGTDDYMTKKQVEKEFHTKGVYYANLFDTELHRKLSAADIKRLNKSYGDDALHYNYSVSDVLKMAKHNNLRLSRINIISGPPRIGVQLNITCDEREKHKVLKNLGEYIFWMYYMDNKWCLTVLDIRRFF